MSWQNLISVNSPFYGKHTIVWYACVAAVNLELCSRHVRFEVFERLHERVNCVDCAASWLLISNPERARERERDTHTPTHREREREREKTVKCSAFRRAMEIENGLLYISESCYYWCAPVSDPCWGNLNCSRTMEGITIGFWVTIEGYLSYLLLKFEDLIPTSLGSEAI